MDAFDRELALIGRILSCCSGIERTVERFGQDYEVFRRDPDYINSVCMNLLQIGEYAGRLSERFAEETGAEMDWRQMKSMRNLFAHNYGQMKTDVVWVTVMEDLPALADFCRRILHDKKNEQE